MRRKIIAGIAAVSAVTLLQVVSPTAAFACHKGKAHGGQVEVTVEDVQEDPIVCGRLL